MVDCWVVVLCPQHHAAGGTQMSVGTVSPSLNNTGVYTYAAGHSLLNLFLFGHWAKAQVVRFCASHAWTANAN